MKKAVNFLTGLIFGALLGAAAGLLTAPQSGDDTQATLRQRFTMMMEEGRKAAGERRAELESQFAEAKRFSKAV